MNCLRTKLLAMFMALVLILCPVGVSWNEAGFSLSYSGALAQMANAEELVYTYGEWSGNKTTTAKPTESDTLRIVSTSTKYTYYRYCGYYDGRWQQDSVPYGSGCTYHEITLGYQLTACPNKFPDHGGKAYDLHGPYNSCDHKREGQSYWWSKKTETTYTYQTRSKTVASSSSKGTVEGLVFNASSGASISGATVAVYYSNGNLAKKCVSDSSGRYSLVNLSPGTYCVKVSCRGFIILKATLTVRKGQTTYCDNALLVKKYSGKGTAKGCIRSATTGKVLKGMKISFKKGWYNPNGKTVATAKTNSKGCYRVKLKAGYYTAVCTSSKYIKFSFNIIVKKGTTANQNASASPAVAKGKYRVVLTWGRYPTDLDSHLVSPKSGGSNYHVYYARKTLPGSKLKLANLDVDDVNGFGPETVTFTLDSKKKYRYYVYQFSPNGRLCESDATVRLYKGKKLVRTFHVPTIGYSRVWNVFTVDGGKLKSVNTITDMPSKVSNAFALEGRH